MQDRPVAHNGRAEQRSPFSSQSDVEAHRRKATEKSDNLTPEKLKRLF